ncbi:Pyridoxamine 5'-phosphate oxidase [Patulibacter medicamentivorans]|uniref:Pyridoxine/pyridoxamine 5'-phosphate oxidase n=1 Tax=Patulibacter medicamentivorans TaxID=1097667 RepID=H0EAK8_9ACTN|nr:pyridoxamine 5'-phosphate oxidase [Patulibacter medicamentivorans]EHN09335.1 Pyridoxamine 5'-phosphate oxidase [Patulibacter medicamentivorans]
MGGLGELRRTYDGTPLERGDLHPDPMVQVAHWVAEARDALDDTTEVNAVALATADAEGRPSVRMVLLKDLDARGLTFYTNLASRKGHELRQNPYAALCLHWTSLFRQIRVSGPCAEVGREEAAAYFATRPAGSKRGAWASHQSAPIEDRAALEARMAHAVERFPDDGDVPLPPHWGGFRVTPVEVELWQGRPDRMHDRFRYRRDDAGAWVVERLQP